MALEPDVDGFTHFRPLSPSPTERSTNSVADFFMRFFERGNESDQAVTVVPQGNNTVNNDPSTVPSLSVCVDIPATTPCASSPSSPYMVARSFSTVTGRITNLLTRSASGLGSTSDIAIADSPDKRQRPLKDYNSSDFRQYWMPDSRGKECYECQEKFTTFRRRHHCRICGQIFCSRCCKQEIPGRLLGYMGDLRLCNYCCRVVLQYLNSPPGELAWRRGGSEADMVQLRANLLRTLADSTPRSANTESHDVHEVNVEDDENTDEDLFDPLTPRKLSTASEAWSTPVGNRLAASRHRQASISSTISDQPMLAIETMSQRSTNPSKPPLSKSPSNATLNADGHSIELADNESEEPDWLRLIETTGETGTRQQETNEQSSATVWHPLASDLADSTNSGQGSRTDSLPRRHNLGRKTSSLDVFQRDESYYRKSSKRGVIASRRFLSATPLSSKFGSTGSNRAGLNFQERATPSNVHYGPLHKTFEAVAQKVLEYLLRRSNVNVARWKPVLWPLTQEIAFSVQPQVRSRKDDMDAVRYVHVKTVQSSLIPSAQVVFGTVCTKSVADKRMPKKFVNPTIFVVGGSVEYERVAGKFCPIDPIIMQEKEYLQSLVRKIAALKPQVLVVEKSVARLAQDYCLQAGLTLVCNLKPSAVRRIARSVEAGVAPSVEDQLIKPRMGRCGSFRTETYTTLAPNKTRSNSSKTKTLMFFEDCPPDLGCAIILTGPILQELILVKKVAKFMIGAAYSSKMEIELLRAYQACIDLETVLERPLASDQSANGCAICVKNDELSVDKNICTDDGDSTDELESARGQFVQRVEETSFTFSAFIGINLPFLQTLNGSRCNLRPFFNMERLCCQCSDDKEQDTRKEATPNSGNGKCAYKEDSQGDQLCDHDFIKAKLMWSADSLEVRAQVAQYRAQSAKLFRKKLEMEERNEWGGQTRENGENAIESKGPNSITPLADVLDPFAHRRIAVLYCSYSPKSENAPGFCLKPRVFVMHFYGRFDVTLGDYLERYCFDPIYECANESCEASMTNHIRKLVHGNCCVEITTQNIDVPSGANDSSKTNSDLVEQHILCWNWCGVCKTTTPATPMNVEFWHLSFARYLEYLFNGIRLSSYTVRETTCDHCLFHQHQHYFAFRNSVVSFKCSPIVLYDISFPPLVCRSQPDRIKAMTLVEDTMCLSEKAGEVFSHMLEVLCGLTSLVQPDGTSPPPVAVTSVGHTVADLQRLHENEQEAFRNQLAVAQALLPSFHSDDQLETTDQKYLTIIDSHTISRHILARCIQQWNLLVCEVVASLKKKQLGEESRTNLTKLVDTNAEKQSSNSSPVAVGSGAAAAATAQERSSDDTSNAAKRVSADSGDRKQLTKVLSIACLSCPFDPPEHYAILSKTVPVIMRDSEISSVVAFSLCSDEYENQRKAIRESWSSEGVVLNLRNTASIEDSSPASPPDPDDASVTSSGAQEHIELQFADGAARFYCKIYYAEKFRLLRKLILPEGEDAFARSLARCKPWQPKGGKSGANFYITHDRRFILKQLSRFEVQSFLKFAPNYFQYMASVCSENKLSSLAKIYGVYRIGLRNPQTNCATKLDILVMEYLFYNRNISQMYDLKGSLRNRLASEKRQTDLVLLDENLLKTVCSNSFYLYPHSKSALNLAINNDSEFLALNSIMDYSLLVGVDEERKELVLGIIDFMRTFTWDKKVESWVKSVSVTGQLPTVISPDLYRVRFVEVMDVYFPVAPDQWTGLT